MKKTTFLGVAFATLISVVAVSCQKERVSITEFTATIETCTDGSSKVMLDGNVLRWTDGDQIAVTGSEGRGIYTTTNTGEYVTTFTLNEDSEDPGGPTYTALYPASWAARTTILLMPPVQCSPDGSLHEFPMMAKSSSSELVFKNLCGALRLRLQANGKSITGIELTATSSNLWGMFNINYNNGDPTMSYYTNGGNQVLLSIARAQDISIPKDFYVAMPVGTYGEGFTIRIYASDGSVCTKTITTGHNFSIERSGIFTITLLNDNMMFEPNAGMLSGEFSVSTTRKVRFSQGNLHYTGFGIHTVANGGTAEGVWRFGSSQGEDVSLSGSNYSSRWIDEFPWASSGWDGGAMYHMPYENSGLNSPDYGYGLNDLTGTYAYADWGVYNAIFNGGNQPQQWRTLSSEEWDYLLYQRRGHSVKWGVAQVQFRLGVNATSYRGGIVILPDSWNLPDGLEFNEGIGLNGYGMNRYTSNQWTQMEAAGAVFLPGSYYYWSTTHGTDTWSAYCQHTHWNDMSLTYDFRSRSYKVRLVRDVN